MANQFPELSDELSQFIGAQKMFFVLGVKSCNMTVDGHSLAQLSEAESRLHDSKAYLQE